METALSVEGSIDSVRARGSVVFGSEKFSGLSRDVQKAALNLKACCLLTQGGQLNATQFEACKESLSTLKVEVEVVTRAVNGNAPPEIIQRETSAAVNRISQITRDSTAIVATLAPEEATQPVESNQVGPKPGKMTSQLEDHGTAPPVGARDSTQRDRSQDAGPGPQDDNAGSDAGGPLVSPTPGRPNSPIPTEQRPEMEPRGGLHGAAVSCACAGPSADYTAICVVKVGNADGFGDRLRLDSTLHTVYSRKRGAVDTELLASASVIDPGQEVSVTHEYVLHPEDDQGQGMTTVKGVDLGTGLPFSLTAPCTVRENP